jgi:molybdate transport system substrate-binding protein
VRLAGLAALLAAALLVASCGGDEGGGKPELTVFAASSLEPAFESYAGRFEDAEVAFSFAGSDTLAAQIRQGVEPDVFAAASTTYPEELFQAGLLEKPVVFATNELVLAVPADSEIGSVADVARAGTSVAIGAEGVPVGDYTREVLDALPGGEGEAILANVGSEEPDVSGIVGKLTQGAVDAGFVYRSDVAAAGEQLRAIEIAARISPEVAYGAGVGSSSGEPELAQDFIDGLIDGAGADALAANEFGPPRDAAGGS